MLSLIYLRKNTEKAKEGLAKRNFSQLELIDQVLEVDQNRRSLQTQLDEVHSKSNKLAKEIGMLFKSGEETEANKLKSETSNLKLIHELLITIHIIDIRIIYFLSNTP